MPLNQKVQIAEIADKYGVSSIFGSVGIRVPDVNNNNEIVLYTVSGKTVSFYKYGSGTSGTSTGCTLTYVTD